MRSVSPCLVLVLASIPILALAATPPSDLGARMPHKPLPASGAPAPASPSRQGGDTIADAVPVAALPAILEGTTLGYTDDYDESCPYDGSTSPDVVYVVTPDQDSAATIDLQGSAYDTKVYVYDANLDLIACNDDYHDDYTSYLAWVPLAGGEPSYIVVDGYNGAAGDYVLAIGEFDDFCDLECPPGGQAEGEPPLVNGYVDEYNAGCGGPVGGEFTAVTAPVFCGRGGWYLYEGDISMRDTDWLWVTLPPSGVLEITADAEWPTYVFELGPQDCANVGVLQSIAVGRCEPGSMVITGEPSSLVWIWVGAQEFSPPDGEYPQEFDYVLLLDGPVAVQGSTWSAIRDLYR